MTKRSVTHGSFTIERVYEARPSRVFAALLDPAEKSKWFHGPEEWGPEEYSMDFREGGLGTYLSRESAGTAPATAPEGRWQA